MVIIVDENIEKVVVAPKMAMFICFFLAWGLLFVPFPPINYFIAAPLIFAGLVLAIICLAKNAVLAGVSGVFLGFIVTPIIYLVSIGLFLSLISDVFNEDKPIEVIKEQVKERVIQAPIITAPPAPKEELPPPPMYKHKLVLNNGRIIVADSILINGNIVTYNEGYIKVTINKSDLKSYQKIVIKR